jgi:glycerophosphoryl diester phosphodiesterase
MSSLHVPRVIGHRGAKARAPENTLAGLRQAKRDGAAWVEFDVKLTADGQPVLIHDETLERTTDGHGRVADMAFADIRRLDAGRHFGAAWQGERVPSLREALTLLAELKMGFNLEIKPCPGREAETARVAMAEVAASWPSSRPMPIVSSFSAEALAAARAAGPQDGTAALGYLVADLPADWQAEASRLGCQSVHVGWRNLARRQVAAVKAAGYILVVWTVNERSRAAELLAWGADAVISDHPAALAGL